MTTLTFSSHNFDTIGKLYFVLKDNNVVKICKQEEELQVLAGQFEIKESFAIQNSYIIQQINDYLLGRSTKITVNYEFITGTSFQRKVWKELLQIKYGEKISYKMFAEQIGIPNSTRAVASAIAKNPIPIVIPCHRVIKSDGSYGDFVWGQECKKTLLKLEFQ